MFRNKKDVDRYAAEVLNKARNEKEKCLRCLTVAQHYMKIADYESAKKYINLYLSTKDDSPTAHKLAGECHEYLGDRRKALEEYKYSLTLNIKQPDLILKVCELMSDTETAIDKEQAKYWCEKGEAYYPQNRSVFKLRQRLLSTSEIRDISSIENHINKEVLENPGNCLLWTQLLNLYVDSGKTRLAYEKALKRSFTNTDSIFWFECCDKVCVAYKEQYSDSLDSEFFIFYLFVLDRLLAFSIQEFNSDAGKSTSDCVNYLLRFDEVLLETSAVSTIAQTAIYAQYLQNMFVQLCFHIANIILKISKQKDGNWKEHTNFVAALFKYCTSLYKGNYEQANEDNLKLLLDYFRNIVSFNVVQAGYMIEVMNRGHERLLREQPVRMLSENWQEQIIKTLLSFSSIQNLIPSDTYFVKYTKRIQIPTEIGGVNFLPPNIDKHLTRKSGESGSAKDCNDVYRTILKTHEDMFHHGFKSLRIERNISRCTSKLSTNHLNLFDVVLAEEVYPGSLHHLVWLGLNCLFWDNKSVLDSKLPGRFSSVGFESLSFTNKQSSPNAESLSLLDVNIFLFATIFCTKALLDEIIKPGLCDSFKPYLLPADVSDLLCTADQNKWWQCAYQMCKKTFSDKDIVSARTILQNGIEVVRLQMNHPLHPKILVQIARTLMNQAKELADVPERSEAIEKRGILFWNAALECLENIRNKKPFSPSKQLFNYIGKDLTNAEINCLQNEGKMVVATKLMADNNYENALTVFQQLHNPYSYYNQALIYMKLVNEETERYPDNKLNSVVHSNAVMLLNKAQKCLHSCKESINSDKSHPLFNDVCIKLADVNDLLKNLEMQLECGFTVNDDVSCTDKLNRCQRSPIAISTPEKNSFVQSKFNFTNAESTSTEKKQMLTLMDQNFKLMKKMDSLLEKHESLEMQNRDLCDIMASLKIQIQDIREDINGMKSHRDPSNLENELLKQQLNASNAQASAYNFMLRNTGPALFPTFPMPGVPATGYFPTYAAPGSAASTIGSTICYPPQNAGLPAMSIPPFIPPTSVLTTTPLSSQLINEQTVSTSPKVIKQPVAPANVVITASDVLPTTTSVPQPALSVTIPLQFRSATGCSGSSGNTPIKTGPSIYSPPHPFQISMPTTISTLKSPSNNYIVSSVEVPMAYGLDSNKSNIITQTPLSNILFECEGVVLSYLDGFSWRELRSGKLQVLKCHDEDSLSINVYPVQRVEKPIVHLVQMSLITINEKTITYKVPKISGTALVYERYSIKFQSVADLEDFRRMYHLHAQIKEEELFEKETLSKVVESVISAAEDEIFSEVTREKVNLGGFTFASSPILKQVPHEEQKSQSKVETKPASSIFASLNFGISNSGGSIGSSSPLSSTLSKVCFTSPSSTVILSALSPGTSITKAAGTFSPTVSTQITSPSISTADDFVPTAEFKPVIPLPDLIEVKTGEEGLELLYEQRCKLLRFAEKEWKERGIGNIQIFYDPMKKQVRLLMRREQVFTVCCNQYLTPNHELKPFTGNDKAWSWCGKDFSDGVLKDELLAVRFKTVEQAISFKRAFDEAKLKLSPKEQQLPISATICGSNTVDDAVTDITKRSETDSDDAEDEDEDYEDYDDEDDDEDYEDEEEEEYKEDADEKETGGVNKVIKPLSEMFKPESGTWECDECFVRNKENAYICICCNKARSGFEPIQNLSPATSTTVLTFGTASSTVAPTFNFGIKNNSHPFRFGTQQESSTSSCSFGTISSCSFSNAPLSFTFGLPSAINTSDSSSNSGSNIFKPQSSSEPFTSVSATTTAAAVDKPFFGKTNFSAKTDGPTFMFGNSSTSSPFLPTQLNQTLKPFSFQLPTNNTTDRVSITEITDQEVKSADNSLNQSNENDDSIHFEPIIPLPDKVPVITGEENETVLYEHRAKLFRYMESEWKERGLGNIKILRHRETGKIRFLMRREPIEKICLNHYLFPELELKEKSDRSYIWSAPDYSDEVLSNETFAIMFKTAEIAKNFKSEVDKALSLLKGFSEEDVSGTTPSDEVEIVFETEISEDERKRAEQLKLPPHFFAYKYKKDQCPGCVGCNDTEENEKTPAVATKEQDNNNIVTTKIDEKLESDNFRSTEITTSNIENVPKSQQFTFGSILSKDTNVSSSPCSTTSASVSSVSIFSGKGFSSDGIKFKESDEKATKNTSFVLKAPIFGFGNSKKEEESSSPNPDNLFSKSDLSATSANSSSPFQNNKTSNIFGSPNLNGSFTSTFGSSSLFSFDTKPTFPSLNAVVSSANTSFSAPSTVSSSVIDTPVFGSNATSALSFTSSSFLPANTSFNAVFTASSSPIFSFDTKPTFPSLNAVVSNATAPFSASSTVSSSITDTPVFGSNATPALSFTGISSLPTFSTFPSNSTTTVTHTTKDSLINNTSLFTSTLNETSKQQPILTVKDDTLSFAALASSGQSKPAFGKASQFSWPGAGSSVFGSNGSIIGSPNKDGDINKETAEDAKTAEDGEAADDSKNISTDEHDPHFDPIIPLPAMIEVKTGEEDEEIKFSARAKLYRFHIESKEWKERGVGELKILHNPAAKTYRLLLRREQVHKVVLNQRLSSNFTLQRMTTNLNSWCWIGMNMPEEQNEPVMEKLAVRFKTENFATDFHDMVMDCIGKIADMQRGTIEVAESENSEDRADNEADGNRRTSYNKSTDNESDSQDYDHLTDLDEPYEVVYCHESDDTADELNAAENERVLHEILNEERSKQLDIGFASYDVVLENEENGQPVKNHGFAILTTDPSLTSKLTFYNEYAIILTEQLITNQTEINIAEKSCTVTDPNEEKAVFSFTNENLVKLFENAVKKSKMNLRQN